MFSCHARKRELSLKWNGSKFKALKESIIHGISNDSGRCHCCVMLVLSDGWNWIVKYFNDH